MCGKKKSLLVLRSKLKSINSAYMQTVEFQNIEPGVTWGKSRGFKMITYNVMKKVKCSHYRASVVQRVGRGIALLFHDRGTRRGWVVSSTPRPQFTPGKDPVPILQEAGWAPGPVWTGGNSRPHRHSIPNFPARSSVTILTELPGPQYITWYISYIYIFPNFYSLRFRYENYLHILHTPVIARIIFLNVLNSDGMWRTA